MRASKECCHAEGIVRLTNDFCSKHCLDTLFPRIRLMTPLFKLNYSNAQGGLALTGHLGVLLASSWGLSIVWNTAWLLPMLIGQGGASHCVSISEMERPHRHPLRICTADSGDALPAFPQRASPSPPNLRKGSRTVRAETTDVGAVCMLGFGTAVLEGSATGTQPTRAGRHPG